jgi:hypothetical protein
LAGPGTSTFVSPLLTPPLPLPLPALVLALSSSSSSLPPLFLLPLSAPFPWPLPFSPLCRRAVADVPARRFTYTVREWMSVSTSWLPGPTIHGTALNEQQGSDK